MNRPDSYAAEHHPQPEDVRAIQAAIGDLDNSLTLLEAAVERLGYRLKPALTPEAPQPIEDNQKVASAPSRSYLTSELELLASRVRRVTYTAGELSERLEL